MAMHPITQLQARLDALLTQQLEVEDELAAARRALEDADAQIRDLDQQRAAAEARVAEARDAIEQARLAAQESRVRREALAEQFVATQYELPEITPGPARGGGCRDLGAEGRWIARRCGAPGTGQSRRDR